MKCLVISQVPTFIYILQGSPSSRLVSPEMWGKGKSLVILQLLASWVLCAVLPLNPSASVGLSVTLIDPTTNPLPPCLALTCSVRPLFRKIGLADHSLLAERQVFVLNLGLLFLRFFASYPQICL